MVWTTIPQVPDGNTRNGKSAGARWLGGAKGSMWGTEHVGYQPPWGVLREVGLQTCFCKSGSGLGDGPSTSPRAEAGESKSFVQTDRSSEREREEEAGRARELELFGSSQTIPSGRKEQRFSIP